MKSSPSNNQILTLENSGSHIFSIYSERVRWITQNNNQKDIQNLDDSDLVYRINVVLRLSKNDSFILFDSNFNIFCSILNVEPRKSLTIEIHQIKANKQLLPEVIWLLPILKKDAFEEAIYILTELGSAKIQPIVTEKAHRPWGGQKEVDRCKKIMIAAAEQSKQFVIPQMLPINTLNLTLSNYSRTDVYKKIFFDKQGISLESTINYLKEANPTTIIACSGPEGDLTYREKSMLLENNFTFCQLTQTTLRAPQAITIGFGSIRSLIRAQIIVMIYYMLFL